METIMAGFLDSAEIEIPCEVCRRKTKKSIGWIKGHKEFACGCGAIITLDPARFKSEIAKAERALTGLHGSLKKLGK
jgi:hypothetical protein